MERKQERSAFQKLHTLNTNMKLINGQIDFVRSSFSNFNRLIDANRTPTITTSIVMREF